MVPFETRAKIAGKPENNSFMGSYGALVILLLVQGFEISFVPSQLQNQSSKLWLEKTQQMVLDSLVKDWSWVGQGLALGSDSTTMTSVDSA